MKRLTMTNGNEELQLDPELWKKLPEELLERVIAKLPFFIVVAFRTVCKSWYSDIIPRVAPRLDVSSSSAILYFQCLSEAQTESKIPRISKSKYLCISDAPYPSALCLHVCNAKSDLSIGSVVHFHQDYFLAPRDGEYLQLLLCEKGLLFLGYKVQHRDLWRGLVLRDIVVYNPLISKSKSLGLPCPLQEPMARGVVFDTETGSYCLVCSEVHGKSDYRTYLYHSTTSEWTNGPSLLPTLKDLGEDKILWFPPSGEGVSCNGNLYWYAHVSNIGRPWGCLHVLKFDIQQVTWSLIPDPFVDCRNVNAYLGCHNSCVMASYNEEILLCDLHQTFFNGYNPRIPCRFEHNLELAPEIKPMPQYVMEKIYGLVKKGGLGVSYLNTHLEYRAVSEGNSIYHVLSRDGGLSILVQDASVNSFTELPRVVPEALGREYFASIDQVWIFSPSLTSVP